jgi:hypothetical protein
MAFAAVTADKVAACKVALLCSATMRVEAERELAAPRAIRRAVGANARASIVRCSAVETCKNRFVREAAHYLVMIKRLSSQSKVR